MDLMVRAESHAADLFKLQDVPGGVLARSKRSFPKSRDDASVPVPGGTSPGSAGSSSGVRRIPKSKTTINLATIAEEQDAKVVVVDADDAAVVIAATTVGGGGGMPARPDSPVKKSLGQWFTMRSLTNEDVARIHYEDLFGCFTRNFGKGAALGFFGKVGINVFMEVVGVMRRRGLPTTPLLATALEGAREHGMFLGMLLSVFNSFMYATRKAPLPYARYRGAMAGAVSGLASLWALPGSMRRAALLFLSVRAFELACRVGARGGTLPTLQHGDTALMSAASALMIYEWMLHPGSLDAAYVHFLNRQVQFSSPVVRAVAAMQEGLPLDVEAVNRARSAFKPPPLPISDPFAYDKMPGTLAKAAFMLHPTQSFARFAAEYFVRGLRLSLPVYLPVYAVPMLLFQHKRLRAKPADTLLATAKGVATSTAFLATYCTLGITSISVFRAMGMRHDVMGSAAVLSLPLSGALAGLATLIEKKHRRIELALYVLQRALDGVHKIASKKFGEHVANPVFGDSALFALLLATIFHANLRHNDLVRPAYRSFLTRFFDTDERHVFL